MDLTDNFSKEELAQWDPGSIAEGTYQGRFYGPPEVQSCQSLWYNQAMVDAAGSETQHRRIDLWTQWHRVYRSGKN